MHPNPVFRSDPHERNVDFARHRSFGTLAVNGEHGPLLSHVPFLLSEDESFADLHLVRSNPICRVAPLDAVVSVSGPDGYISPDWYEVDDQVPTWNYVAVHLRGRLVPRPADDMRPMLDRQSAGFEERLRPKAPWKTEKMTPDVRDRMMRAILPFRLEIAEITGTWKLNQNKPDDVRLRAAERVGGGAGMELSALSALMKDPKGGF